MISGVYHFMPPSSVWESRRADKGANVETLQMKGLTRCTLRSIKVLDCVPTHACMCLRRPIVPLAVLDPRLFLREMLVACCSVWLPFNQTPRRLER